MSCCRLARRLVGLVMSLFRDAMYRLRHIPEWIWPILVRWWRFTKRIFTPLVGVVGLMIAWKMGYWNQGEAKDTAEAEEGRSGAASEKRPAESGRESTSKRPRVDEQEEEEEEWHCDFDSTWEDEERPEETRKRSRRPAAATHFSRSHKFRGFERAARDMQNYRHGYPSQTNQQRNTEFDDKPNFHFYCGWRRCIPDDQSIHDFHKDWFGKYDQLERVHSYIQWLFPLQEPGMNYSAVPLTKQEIEEFCNSATALENLSKSYKLMLDFYGIELCDENTGEVKRAENWKERFKNLNRNTHNNLRITRILKCLGTLGFPHYQAPLVCFFLEETLVNKELPNVKDSVLNYFVFAVLDKGQRKDLIKFAYMNYDRKDEFVWCPKKIQMAWSQEGKTE